MSPVLEVRERAAEHGIRVLDNKDLMSLLLGPSWTPVATDLPLLARMSRAFLGQHYTARQADVLWAAFELGRRAVLNPPTPGERVRDPQRVHDLFRREAEEDTESFHAVFLDVRGRLIARSRIATGDLSFCAVAPRQILRAALMHNAHGVIFVHNHPSGDPSPSPEDVDLTHQLRAAAELVGIVPHDHVIVASRGHYSFVGAGRWRR